MKALRLVTCLGSHSSGRARIHTQAAWPPSPRLTAAGSARRLVAVLPPLGRSSGLSAFWLCPGFIAEQASALYPQPQQKLSESMGWKAPQEQVGRGIGGFLGRLHLQIPVVCGNSFLSCELTQIVPERTGSGCTHGWLCPGEGHILQTLGPAAAGKAGCPLECAG